MYSTKLNSGILTAQLIAHGIEDVVVCPGSRNAALVHDFLMSERLRLFPVTDERSAAFVAIGLMLKSQCPTAICVTSGTALLNALPAVAEAALRHMSLIVISADRPEEWIGQLDGQTIPQTNALEPYAHTWTLKEVKSETEQWYCNRQVNEAINYAVTHHCPIHLNVPLSEPLFEFETPHLPTPLIMKQYSPLSKTPIPNALVAQIEAAHLPVLVMGHLDTPVPSAFRLRDHHQLLLHAECLSLMGDTRTAMLLERKEIVPDLVVHIGGAMIGKHFKLFLRSLPHCPVIRIDPTNECPDTFQHLTTKITADPEMALAQLSNVLSPKPAIKAIMARLPETSFRHYDDIEAIFLGNSSSVRIANRFFTRTTHPLYGNRGTNGIEGSLSVAAGYALRSEKQTLCILGDLSFFYDANALWNERLDGRLRILMLNNGCGDIFYHLPGLKTSPALNDYIAAAHRFNARGIAESYSCTYLTTQVENFENELDTLIRQLQAVESTRPVLFEVFTYSSLPIL